MDGFTKALGRCNAMNAKLWGVLEGLNLLHRRRITRVMIHINSKEAHKAITKKNYHMGISMNLLRQIHKDLNKLVEFQIKLVFPGG